jgi:hypothetical protein
MVAFVEGFKGRHIAGGGSLRQTVVRLLRLLLRRLLFAFGALKEWECGSVCGHHVLGILQASCRRKIREMFRKSTIRASLQRRLDQKGLPPTESV